MDNSTVPYPSPQSPPPKWSWLCFVTICLLGIILNIGVFWKRKFATRRQSSTTHISLSLLCVMAAADTVCLVALLFLLSLRYLGITNALFFSMVCKLDVFIIHAASAFSIWCWLVLSAVRYMAIYRPYTHLKLHKEPHMAVISIAVLCCVSESWLLYDITYVPELKGCESLRDEATNRKLQIFEILISYFLPLVIITVLDLKVLFCRSVWFTGVDSVHKCTQPVLTIENAEQNEMKSKRRAQQVRVLRRMLCITIFDLGMNLPSYLYRLYLNTLDEEEFINLNQEMLAIIEMTSQIMYFAQFSLNALYLVCIIYDTPKNKKKLPHQQSTSTYMSRTISSKKSNQMRENKQLIVPEF